MIIKYLGNGSSGNSTYFSDGTTSILIDNGLPLKKVPEVNGGILISHKHSDHFSGVEKYCKKYGIRAVVDTSFYIEEKIPASFLHIENFRKEFQIGTLNIKPFDVWHDEVCYGFIINKEYIHLTDTGKIPFTLLRYLSDLPIKVLYIESNYDESLIEDSSYDPMLIARIRGLSGHLSNQNVVEFLSTNSTILNKLEKIVIGHMSENTNNPTILNQRIDESVPGNIKDKILIGENIEISIV